MRLYGIAWDGWKLLNIGDKDELMNQVKQDWWIYDTYAIVDATTSKTVATFTKNEVHKMVG